jgi:hypothetical protein
MVMFSNFHRLDPDARDVTLELLANADQHEPPSFMSFAYRWMAFNGWMSAVTLEDRDWKMVNAVAAAVRLIDAHDQLMATTDTYRQQVNSFAAMWPVFNVRDVRKKLGYDAFVQHGRAALLATTVKRQPETWLPGSMPSWDQVIRAIYQVRSNLFHGEKSPQSSRDRDLILASDGILRAFIEQSQCFDWHDL